MANFWDNDEVVELVVEPEVTVEAPKAETTGTNFWDKDTVVGLIDLATTPETPAPVSEDPDRQFLQSGVPMEDRVFEPEAVVLEEPVVDTASVDAAVEEAIEQPTAEATTTETEEATPATTTFATITKNGTSTTVDETVPLTSGFDSLTLAEGTTIHLDGRGFVTLPHGIVPDANTVKKADGTTFDPTGSHKLKAGDLSTVDYSEATKFGISRKDYTDDESWAKAVYAEFGDRTATGYGTGFDTLSDSAKQAAYDMAWNAGVGSASWSSVQTMLTEASKEDDTTKTTDNLIGFTTNFKSGTETVNGVSVNNYPRGLLKRRLATYNLVAKPGEEAATITTTAVMKNGVRTGTTYDIKKSDGTVLKSWTKPDLNERLGDLEID